MDTIGNCQRPVFLLAVSQHMHKITNLWKFELDCSSELRDNYERKNHPCHAKLCAFRCLISRPQILNLRSRNQIHWKQNNCCLHEMVISPTAWNSIPCFEKNTFKGTLQKHFFANKTVAGSVSTLCNPPYT